MHRIVMNGFAMYTTWTVIASLINLNTSLAYVGGLDMKEIIHLWHLSFFCTGDVYTVPFRFLYISKLFCINGCLEGGRLCHPTPSKQPLIQNNDREFLK